MDNISSKDPPEDKPLKRFSFMNIITLSIWNRLTKRERGVAFTSWNISSWVTIGQFVGGKWLWAKVSPWLVPAAKSVWAKVSVALFALKEAL